MDDLLIESINREWWQPSIVNDYQWFHNMHNCFKRLYRISSIYYYNYYFYQ